MVSHPTKRSPGYERSPLQSRQSASSERPVDVGADWGETSVEAERLGTQRSPSQ
jgi:hypothetical protein